MAPATLTGPQKAAVLLLQVGKERSAKVLKTMSEVEVADIMAEVARLRKVDTGLVDDVLGEFTEKAGTKMAITSGGLELARSMLEETLGEEKAGEIIDRVSAGMVDL